MQRTHSILHAEFTPSFFSILTRRRSRCTSYCPPPDLPVEALPPAFKSDQQAAYFEISAQKADSGATVHRLLRLAESKFGVPEYPNLRLFYDKTRQGDSQQIVLRKADTGAAH